MLADQVGIWVDVLGLAFVVVAGVFGLITFRRDLEHKKTDWLYTLFERFYEKDTYKRVRAVLDYPDHRIDQLRRLTTPGNVPQTDEDRELIDAFCDYLNFFEFLSNLTVKGRMERDDLDRMFKYYLDNLKGHEFVIEYAAANSYEALHRELVVRSKAPA